MIPITTVGSRNILNQEVYQKLQLIGIRIVQAGGMIREGDAIGSDKAFQTGALYAAEQMKLPLVEIRETYLHEVRTRTGSEHNPDIGVYSLPKLPHQDLAYKIAEMIHPAWEHCNDIARALHARNCYQVMGKDLLSPSHHLFCYAPPTSEGSISGGTRTAFELARMLGIPRANLYLKANKEKGTLAGEFDSDMARRYFPTKGAMLLDIPELLPVDERLVSVFKNYGLVNPTFLEKCKTTYRFT